MAKIVTLDRKSKEIVTSNPLLGRNKQRSLLKTGNVRKLLLQIHFWGKIGKNYYSRQEI